VTRRVVVIALALVAFAPLFVLALYPPVAFDETLYHLPLVRLLAQGKFGFHEGLRFPLFPMLAEVLAVPAYLLGGDTATHLVPLAAMLLTVVLLVKWARLHGVPPLAAAAFAGAPIVVHLATVLYVETVLTLFIVAGFYCLDRATSWRSSLAAGLLLGAACDVKYLAWYFVAVAFIVAVTRRRATWFMAGVIVAAAPMFLWLFLATGDPLFPFVVHSEWALARTPVEPPWTVLRIPWDVVFARHRVNWQPPFTPFFALGLVVLCVAAVRAKRPRFVLLFALGYLLIFTHLPQDARYLVPLLPLVLMEATRAWRAISPPSSRAALALCIVAALPGPAYAIYRIIRNGPPSTYVERTVPEMRALRVAGTARVYACGGEELKALAPGPLLGDHNGPYSYDRILNHGHDPARIHRELRRLGVDMLLMLPRKCPTIDLAPPRFTLVYEDDVAKLWRVEQAGSTHRR
jgi:4-amino-4-deoxy-L-arabinose transferase-like glycosyltransferase